MSMRARAVAMAILGGLVLFGARPLKAQTSTLTVTRAPRTIPVPAAADYAAGAVVDATGIGYTVSRSGGPPTTLRTDFISIRSTSPNLGAGKALSDLQWQRAGTGTWTPMSMTDAVVESRQLSRDSPQLPWSGSVLFRVLVSWANDPPATYSANLVITLTKTTP
jgi:hypothetical protein